MNELSEIAGWGWVLGPERAEMLLHGVLKLFVLLQLMQWLARPRRSLLLTLRWGHGRATGEGAAVSATPAAWSVVLKYALAILCAASGLLMVGAALAMPGLSWQARGASVGYAVLNLLFGYGCFVSASRSRRARAERRQPAEPGDPTQG